MVWQKVFIGRCSVRFRLVKCILSRGKSCYFSSYNHKGFKIQALVDEIYPYKLKNKVLIDAYPIILKLPQLILDMSME